MILWGKIQMLLFFLENFHEFISKEHNDINDSINLHTSIQTYTGNLERVKIYTSQWKLNEDVM